MKTLGQYLRELRDQRDLSLREFANKLKLSAAFISDIELGKRHPSEEVISNMARLLGVSVEELKKHDMRPPVEELKRLTAANPGYAFAFRTVMEKNLSPEDLLELVKKKPRRRTDK